MGNQLAKGWADSKALEVAQRHAAYDLRYQSKVEVYLTAERRRQDLQREAEIAAEESSLP